jgi:PHD/YefM family antitoxin component YafN of YafNO toxin-antitoxin module
MRQQTHAARDDKNGFVRTIDIARAEPVAIDKYERPVVVVVAVEQYERLISGKTTALAPLPTRASSTEGER